MHTNKQTKHKNENSNQYLCLDIHKNSRPNIWWKKNGTTMLRRHWEDIVAYENMCYVLSLSSSSFNARHNGLPTAISLHAQRLPLGPDRSMTTQNDLQIIAKTTCLHSRSIKSMLIVVLCTRIVSIYQPKCVHIYILIYICMVLP